LFDNVVQRNFDYFDNVAKHNFDLNYNTNVRHSAIVTSETNSDSVELVCRYYKWNHYYYFFHGWAALDWYRGYNRTFLIKKYQERHQKYSFISTNRIVGGRRDHRILLMYHLLKQNIKHGLISFPSVCPVEQQPVTTISDKLINQYPDISSTLESAKFPWNMPNESGHPMHSCWLSLFEENASCLIHVITETVYFGRKWHLTEKTFKPICLQMPFVLVSTAGSLKYLKKYGFKTFDTLWDESYDDELDDYRRIEKISALLKQFDIMSSQQKQALHHACWPIVEHNFNHFYSGDFERVLWQEFTTMLEKIKKDFNR
jgi:hypothetical protein